MQATPTFRTIEDLRDWLARDMDGMMAALGNDAIIVMLSWAIAQMQGLLGTATTRAMLADLAAHLSEDVTTAFKRR